MSGSELAWFSVSCFSKIRFGFFPLWYRLTRVVSEKGPLNVCVVDVGNVVYLLSGRCDTAHKYFGDPAVSTCYCESCIYCII